MRYLLVEPDAFAIVDDEDYESFHHLNWKLDTYGYPYRWSRERQKHVYLHVEVLLNSGKSFLPNQVSDHINNNKLDSRRSNLRICTQADNVRNQRIKEITRQAIKEYLYIKQEAGRHTLLVTTK